MSPLAGKPAATDPPNCTPVSRPAPARLRGARGEQRLGSRFAAGLCTGSVPAKPGHVPPCASGRPTMRSHICLVRSPCYVKDRERHVLRQASLFLKSESVHSSAGCGARRSPALFTEQLTVHSLKFGAEGFSGA